VAKKKLSRLKKKDNNDKSTSRSVKFIQKEDSKLKGKFKSMTNAFVQSINEENDSDITSEEGSNSFQASIAMLQEASAKLGNYISMVQKSCELATLNLRKVFLLDSQTTHNLSCNKKIVAKIKTTNRTLNMSGNS
jgi:hypothetical protein